MSQSPDDQAAQGLIFTSISTFALGSYGKRRWSAVTTKVEGAERARLHWLGGKAPSRSDQRSQNTVGRLWWMDHLCTWAEGVGGPRKSDAMRWASKHPQMWHRLLQSSYLSAHRAVFAGLIGIAIEREAETGTFTVEQFRRWISSVNLQAGGRHLGVLTHPEIRTMLERLLPDECKPQNGGSGGSGPGRRERRPKSPDPATLRILSLGCGIQSTAMALLAAEGKIEPAPDVALFADTGWEPMHVHKTFDALQERIAASDRPFSIDKISLRRSLADDLQVGVNARGEPGLSIPVWLKDKDGNPSGLFRRKCTSEYKLVPIQRKARERLGLTPGQRWGRETVVEMWLVISTDEPERMKRSRDKFARNRYPLVELEMSREDCAAYLAEKWPGHPVGRSACVGCPFRSGSAWIEIADRYPEEFARAVEIDKALRSPEHFCAKALWKTPFLHSRRLPLNMAVALDRIEGNKDRAMSAECEGICGV